MGPTDAQPALATTKRKFNRLLEDLTASASTPSLASTLRESNASSQSLNDPSTPPIKRSRVSDVSMDTPRNVSGSERIKALQERFLNTPRKSGERTPVKSRTPVKAVTPRREPNFQPYNQEQFLGRLKTFADVKKWTTKPDAIGEVEWAKRGWVCDMWNTVACKGGCEQRVAIRLRPKRKDAEGRDIEMSEDLALDIDEGLVEKFRELIVDGHHGDCLWRKAGCKDDIYHIPIPNRAKSSAELLARYHSFKAIYSDLPLPESTIHPGPPISEILKNLPSTFFNPPASTTTDNPPTTPAEITAFTCAVFGWSGVCESRISLATCAHCFQRVGLWLYKEDRLQEMSKKIDLPIESLHLNLLESHREHCPWKNAVAQGNPRDGPIANMPAWQTLEYLFLGGNGSGKPRKIDHKVAQSMDMGSLRDRDSVDGSEYGSTSTSTGRKSRDSESLNEKWKKLKAKLKRSTSMKSMKSTKSGKSGKGGGKEKGADTAT